MDERIRSIIIENKSIESCTIFFIFNVGSINEDENNRGVSHFIEHMLFKGTKNIPKSNILLKQLDGFGADYNAFTTNNLTGYYIKVMKEYQLEAFKIFYDMIFNSIFDSKEIETERDVIKEEYIKEKNDSSSLIEDLTMKTVLRNTKYQYPIIGYLKTINKIDRNDLISYWNKYYNQENCVIILNGNVKNNLKKHIKNIKIKNKPFEYPIIKQHNSTNYKLKFKKDNANQTLLSVCFKSFGMNDFNKYTLDLIANILGGNMSSRLFLVLREKYGLVYEIECENTYFRDVGYIQISCSFEHKNLEKTVELIFEEINKLKKEYLNKSEIDSNISYLSSMEMLTKEDTTTLSEEIGTEFILTGKINYPEDNIKNYKKIDKIKINEISNTIFKKNNLSVIIIGNYGNKYVKKTIEKMVCNL